MKPIDLSNVSEATNYKSVTPGGYTCKITSVIDEEKKEYLRIEYDIADGEFKDYFSDLYKSKAFWAAHTIKSYKESALPFFKAFITAVESSNNGFKWDSDETKLRGKYVGFVLAEEEYRKKDGTTGTRLYVDRPRSVDAIKAKDFKIPPKKLLPAEPPAPIDFTDLSGDDSDLPF